MSLDKRILSSKKPLSYFDSEQGNDFIGKECYFSNIACKYEDLDTIENSDNYISHAKGTLSHVHTYRKVDRMFENMDTGVSYRYCLPCEWVKEPEKTYRPYKNVQELFEDIGVDIGDTILFRSKANETEHHALITSYETPKNGAETLSFGGFLYRYTMQELFDSFELFSCGRWLPFGVLEE